MLCTGVALRAFCVFLLTVHLPCLRLFLMHRRNTLCTLGCQPGLWAVNPIQPFSDRRPFVMHRRGASCICVVFVNCAFTVPWAIFDAQAQYFMHSGLPTLSNNYMIYPTAGNLLCTGGALRACWVFLQTVHLPCPGLFLMHRRSTSCILGCHSPPTLLRPRAIFHAQAQCFIQFGCFC